MSRTRSRHPLTEEPQSVSVMEPEQAEPPTPSPRKARTRTKASETRNSTAEVARMLRAVPDPETTTGEAGEPTPESSVEPSLKPVRRKGSQGLRKTLPAPVKSWASVLLDPVVDPEIEAKMKQIPTDLNEYGFDPWGLNPLTARYGYSVFAWFYRNYWRVKVNGMENVPSGRVLLIGNHSGQIPIDGVMISVAMLLEANPPRIARAMVERWFTTMPVVGKFIARQGSIVGDPLNCQRLLQKGEAILVFPEGIRGSGKLWRDRYKLMKFGLGFMRLAIATNTPIVPIGVVGGEEQAPSLVDMKPVAKLLGLPYLPITPTFPWLGLLGAIPYPTKYHIYFGKPLTFRGASDDRDEVIQKKVDVVKRSIRQLIDRGLEERESIF